MQSEKLEDGRSFAEVQSLWLQRLVPYYEEDPESRCITDSTAILTLLDSRLEKLVYHPSEMIGVLTTILKEYFDEWTRRWAVPTK